MGHALDVIEDQLAILVNTLGNEGKVDLYTSAAEHPCECRNLGVCL